MRVWERKSLYFEGGIYIRKSEQNGAREKRGLFTGLSSGTLCKNYTLVDKDVRKAKKTHWKKAQFPSVYFSQQSYYFTYATIWRWGLENLPSSLKKVYPVNHRVKNLNLDFSDAQCQSFQTVGAAIFPSYTNVPIVAMVSLAGVLSLLPLCQSSLCLGALSDSQQKWEGVISFLSTSQLNMYAVSPLLTPYMSGISVWLMNVHWHVVVHIEHRLHISVLSEYYLFLFLQRVMCSHCYTDYFYRPKSSLSSIYS